MRISNRIEIFLGSFGGIEVEVKSTLDEHKDIKINSLCGVMIDCVEYDLYYFLIFRLLIKKKLKTKDINE